MSSSNLNALRALFADTRIVGPNALDFYVLPRTDFHNSEYLAAQDERVKFLSGFSGSNAFAIIGKSEAFLWTDGRYFDQATKELQKGWTLMKDGTNGVPSSTDWLLQKIWKGCVIGIDPHLFGYGEAKSLIKQINASNAFVVPITKNLVDRLWKDRPEPEIQKVIRLSKNGVGEDIPTKLNRVRNEYVKKKCDSIIIGALDEIAWLFNLRGADIPFNPVFFSVAVVTNDSAHLFIDERKLDQNAINHLKDVEIHPYDSVIDWLTNFHSDLKRASENHRVFVTSTTNYAWGSVISEENTLVGVSPIQKFKSTKNKAELEGMRNAHIRDSGALVQFFHWLETEIKKGTKISENEAATKSLEFRSQVQDFVSLSFNTISAVGAHAGFPHYHPTEESGKVLIDPNNVYLIDSGGQYIDGTTDVTRTFVFGKASEEVKRMNTLVLKGHIINAMQIVPNNINAMRLDSLARMSLWEYGYDFGHGVGHGVGHFLNVHEFPASIGYRFVNNENILSKGGVVTIEPGYYDAKKFGIRIENCYEMASATNLESKSADFIKFQPLTLVPIQKSLIVKEMLTEKEIAWLNNYHATCLEKTGAYLKKQRLDDVYEYLKKACEPL